MRISDWSSDVCSSDLGDCPMRVCAAPDYLARHGTPRRVADLSNHNCLSYTLSPHQAQGRWAFGRDGEVLVPVRGDLSANNGDALLAAALDGQGDRKSTRLNSSH